jgi:hypothetical protein
LSRPGYKIEESEFNSWFIWNSMGW